MKKRIGYIFLMICLLAWLFISPAAGDDDQDEMNHYYYSGAGNNITNIMYTEIDWQNCISATIIFSRKYDVGQGDNAYMVFFNDKSLLESIGSLHYTGTQEEKIQSENVNNYIGYKYMGYYYKTDDIESGDGFCVDNIQLYSPDLDINLLCDNGENKTKTDRWILDGFTLESGDLSSGTTLLEIIINESIPFSINITSHDNKDTVDTSPITVTGCVVTESNSTPTVTVNGVTANVQGESPLWDYSVSVPLDSGDNIINATATISNYTKSCLIKVINNNGGGDTSGEAFHNIDIKEIQREFVNKNTKVSYSFNSEGNIIRYINFTGLTNSGIVATKVEILKNTSTLVDTVPSDYIYENLNIWLGNTGWATLQNMEKPIIEFYVEKSWVTENDIDESTIVMNRYNSGSWEELTTTLTAQDADKLYFTSYTAGFASFAVTGKQVVTDEAGGEGMVEQTPEQTIEETPEHTSTQSQEGIPGFCLLFSLIVLFITINYRKK